MGSGVKRKPADKFRLNLPASTTDKTIIGTEGAGGGEVKQDINNTCPVTIHTRLKRQDIAVGTELVLNGSSLRVVTDQEVEVGTVPTDIMNTLQTCLGLGVNYPTIRVITNKRGVGYAEFSQ